MLVGECMKILDNGIAVIETDSHVSQWVQQEGRLDHDRTIELHILPHINEGDHVVDCGANIGTHTIPYAAKVGPEGRVWAFEVNRPAIACLRHNAAPYSQIAVYNKGLSDRFEKPLLISSENAGAAFLRPGIWSEEVECVPLDSLLLSRVNFMKVDCEGYELFALRGAWRTIKRNRPKLFVEINRGALARNQVTPADVTDFLDLFNYEYTRIGDSEDQYDFLCVPRQSVMMELPA